jgi:uncharacterized protein (DUF2062 family)
VIELTRAALRRLLERLLHTHDTPERTAMAYALGVFWGFSPLLGLHTVLGIASAFALNLNRVAVVLGIYSNLPWTLPPYYTVATLLGAALLRVDVPSGLLGQVRQLLEDFSVQQLGRLIELLSPFLWSYVLGSTLGSIVLAVLAYHLALAFIRAGRRLHHTH